MELWKELHTRALNFHGETDIDYLRDFAKRIPQFGTCRCKEDWVKIVRANPPKFGPNGEYFEWSIKCHNFVNEKLGKPTYTIEEAKAFYSKKI